MTRMGTLQRSSTMFVKWRAERWSRNLVWRKSDRCCRRSNDCRGWIEAFKCGCIESACVRVCWCSHNVASCGSSIVSAFDDDRSA